MTVAELIAELQNQPQDAEVVTDVGGIEGSLTYVETVKYGTGKMVTILWSWEKAPEIDPQS